MGDHELEREEAEQLRAEAEGERQRREELRRIGEGGPEQHIPGNILPGRVEAEEQRVAAEQHRSDLRYFYSKLAASIALPLAFIALIPALIGIWMLDNETDARINANREHLEEIDMLAADGVEAKRALCVFRDDLARRTSAAEEFITLIIRGERPPIGGISTADLQRSLKGQQATLAALSDLKCQ